MKYIALLRGINVGGNNRVDMKQLKQLFEKMGYESVTTYINSGNIVFGSNEGDEMKLALDIEQAIDADFGFAVRVIVVSEQVLKHIATKVPPSWTHDSTDKRCEVLFLWPEIDSEQVLAKIESTEVDTLVYYPGAVVWRMDRRDYNRSGMHKLIGSEVYKKSTTRNINTVRKLVELLDRAG